MSLARRSLLSVLLMAVGLIALVVESVDKGWTAVGTIGIACFAVAIAAQLVGLRRTNH